MNLKDSWCSIENGELIVKQMHISPYEHGNIFNRDPLRERKLLMLKAEINRLFGLVKQREYTLIPLSLYFKGSRVKMQLGPRAKSSTISVPIWPRVMPNAIFSVR